MTVPNVNGATDLETDASTGLQVVNRTKLQTALDQLATPATATTDGAMAAADKAKLDGLGSMTAAEIEALLDSRYGSDDWRAQDAAAMRPGARPSAFFSALGAAATAYTDSVVAVDEHGAVARLSGAAVIRSGLTAIEPGRNYLVRVAFERQTNSADPSGDAVEIGVAWYDQAGTQLAASNDETIDTTQANPVVGDGRQTVAFVISRASGTNVDHVAPSLARYAAVFIRTYGDTPVTDAEVLDIVDVTDATLYSPDVTSLDSRVTAVESWDAGTRLTDLEALHSGPEVAAYKTEGAVEAATIGATVDAILVYGDAAIGDRPITVLRRASAEPAHADKVQSFDGAWWERQTTALTLEFDTKTQAEEYRADAGGVPADVGVIKLHNYASAGDGGGAAYTRVDSEPSHSAKLRTSDRAISDGTTDATNGGWWEMVPGQGAITPMQIGATGDGSTDDDTAVKAALAAAVALGTRLHIDRFYAVSDTLAVTDNEVTIWGPSVWPGTAPLAGLRKHSSWTGNKPLLKVGDTGSGNGVSNVGIIGIGLDGNGQSGNGLEWWRGGVLTAQWVSSYQHTSGYGFQVDGVYFPTFIDCYAYQNGDTSAGTGGGLNCDHTERENSDGRWIRGLINGNGNVQIRLGESDSDTLRETDWVFADFEIGDKGGHYEAGEQINYLADIRGGNRLLFRNVKFMQGADTSNDCEELIRLGENGSASDFERVTFQRCTFQVLDATQTPSAILAEGPMRDVVFADCILLGIADLIDTDPAAGAASGSIIINSPEIVDSQISDGAGIIQVNHPFDLGTGFLEAGASAPDTSYRVGFTKAGDTSRTTIEFGWERSAGDGRDMVNFGKVMPRIAPMSADEIEARAPAAGALVYWNGSGTFSTITGITAAGLYCFSSNTAAFQLGSA